MWTPWRSPRGSRGSRGARENERRRGERPGGRRSCAAGRGWSATRSSCTSRSSRPGGRAWRRGLRRGRAPPRIACAGVSQPASPPRRVVIAEDEALIRMDLAEMLAEEGYDVVGQAGDGEQAVALAEELATRPGDPRREDAGARRHRGGRADRRPADRAGGDADGVLPARPRRAGPRRRRDGVPGQALLAVRPGAGHRDGGEPVRRARRPRVRGRRPLRAAGDPQGRGAGQERAPARPRAQRARRLPVDPEDRDGPAPDDASGRRRA